MVFDPEYAAIRFGCGLSPNINPAQSLEAMLSMATGPDAMAAKFPVAGSDEVRKFILEHARLKRETRRGTPAEKRAAQTQFNRYNRKIYAESLAWLGQTLRRRIFAKDALRERLVGFWADHFTATGKRAFGRIAYSSYIDESIRPHVMGNFADLLKAVVSAPLMLKYLDQAAAVGPNSKNARSRKKSGLNENLAREMLELHILGVDGPYTQDDVRQLAELLTGLTYNVEKGFHYNSNRAEPGPETILGVEYGGQNGQLEDIYQALDDLAMHPATGTHLAQKMARYFVADVPSKPLINHMAKSYLKSNGNLSVLTAAMLEHPDSWDGVGKVKQPMDFITSSLRAFDLKPSHIPVTSRKKMMRHVVNPMALMGHQWGQAASPAGLPDIDSAWITPQRLAIRLKWAMTVPFSLKRIMPDPRDFPDIALGSRVTEDVRFAANATEIRAEGIGLVLASPAFQRM